MQEGNLGSAAALGQTIGAVMKPSFCHPHELGCLQVGFGFISDSVGRRPAFITSVHHQCQLTKHSPESNVVGFTLSYFWAGDCCSTKLRVHARTAIPYRSCHWREPATCSIHGIFRGLVQYVYNSYLRCQSCCQTAIVPRASFCCSFFLRLVPCQHLWQPSCPQETGDCLSFWPLYQHFWQWGLFFSSLRVHISCLREVCKWG